jgi:hypothetical protein
MPAFGVVVFRRLAAKLDHPRPRDAFRRFGVVVLRLLAAKIAHAGPSRYGEGPQDSVRLSDSGAFRGWAPDDQKNVGKRGLALAARLDLGLDPPASAPA